MRSLLIRIFVSFWSIIVITIIAAGMLGYLYSERVRTAMENFEVSDALLDASQSLRDGGRDGLADWLRSLPDATGMHLYVLDDQGDDILGRQKPRPIAIAMSRFGKRGRARPPSTRDFGNLRPARPFTQLIGPDGHVYTLFVLPPQGNVGRWLAERGGIFIIILALLISTAISYLLARAMSQPIRRFRESVDAIAGGNLDTRVAKHVGKRRDEIGLLAEDFDRMTDELKRAWVRQTELTRNVSHELRSPLARLRVALELARRKTGDLPELERIDAETEKLDELIGQLLEFSRLDSDPLEERASLDLDELLRSIVEDVRFEYSQLGSNLRFELQSSEVPDFDGFRNALHSGIENVIRNAAQHSPDDGNVVVQLNAADQGVVITIEDEGGGVAPHELDRLFEPFYRAKNNRSDAPAGGSGLGLAIASRAIGLNGGTIVARNGAKGLRVELRLPLQLSGERREGKAD